MPNNPLLAYIQDVYAPVSDERVDHHLEVIGEEFPKIYWGAMFKTTPILNSSRGLISLV